MKRPAQKRRATPKGIDQTTIKDAAETGVAGSPWKEALADLTPGLAHDLNNSLTGMIALSEAYLAQIHREHPFHEGLLLIKEKSQEASQLLHRVARLYLEKPGTRDYQDLNSLTAEIVQILRKVLPRRIELVPKFTSDSLPIYIDAVEFRRVFLSLVSVALQSMPEQGKLYFQTSLHTTLSVLTGFEGELPRLPCVCLNISGGGPGIAPQKIDRLFRPGDTPGRKNRLDLIFEYANRFVAQSHGAITITSELGAGTAFRLWFPQANFTEAEL